MARRKEQMSDEKKNFIAGLIGMYDIKTAEDIHDALKDLMGETLEGMLKAEMSEHLGYDEYERSENGNSRNGTKTKKVISKHGEI
ncbi:MAG: transposase [Oscillospiraceae bacterium]|nr:transposase [Oscillospiraceae bacterium]